MESPQKPPAGPIQEFLNAEEPRRDFFTQAAAVVTSAVLGVVPLFAGLAVFLDPLRPRTRRSDGGADEEGFLKVAPLDGLLQGGAPRRYEVIDDRTDAWNLFPREAVGAVFLVRPGERDVRAFNVKCPHAGCSVDFKPERQCFQCPCHDSSFRPADGAIANPNSPSPRGLDELVVRIKPGSTGDEVWVKYEDFRSGTSEKVSDA